MANLIASGARPGDGHGRPVMVAAAAAPKLPEKRGAAALTDRGLRRHRPEAILAGLGTRIPYVASRRPPPSETRATVGRSIFSGYGGFGIVANALTTIRPFVQALARKRGRHGVVANIQGGGEVSAATGTRTGTRGRQARGPRTMIFCRRGSEPPTWLATHVFFFVFFFLTRSRPHSPPEGGSKWGG